MIGSSADRRPVGVTLASARMRKNANTSAPSETATATNGVALAEQVDDDLDRVVVEQRADRELAEHERDRDDRRREDRAADVGDDDLRDDARPAGTQAARRLGKRRHVDRPQAGVDGAVDEREHEDDVDEHEGQRRSGGVPTDDRVDRRDPDHEHDRGDRQRQQAEELDGPLHPRHLEIGPGHRRDEQEEHPEDGQRRDLERDDDGLDEVRRPRRSRATRRASVGRPDHGSRNPASRRAAAAGSHR